AVHRRRLHRLHQRLVHIPRRDPRRRHTLPATGDHRSDPARRRRQGDDLGNPPQPARPAGARRRAHLPAEDSAAEHTAGHLMSFTRVDALLGAWRLESAVEVFDDGERRDEFGPNPEGETVATAPRTKTRGIHRNKSYAAQRLTRKPP